MPRAVLLDLYGTLVEPDWPSLNAGRSAIALRAGVGPEEAQRAWEVTHVNRMLGRYGSLEHDLAAVFAGAGVSADPAVVRELAEQERANWRSCVRLYPDVAPALAQLREAGFGLAIVTNASAEAASVIPVLGLDRLVDVVVASCDAGVLKPDLLGIALRQLDVTASDAVLIDDERGQTAAARRSGIDAVLIRRGAPPAVADNERVISDFSDLAVLTSREPAPRR